MPLNPVKHYLNTCSFDDVLGNEQNNFLIRCNWEKKTPMMEVCMKCVLRLDCKGDAKILHLTGTGQEHGP